MSYEGEMGQRLVKWRYLNGWGRLDALAQLLSQLSGIALLCSGTATIAFAVGLGHPSTSVRGDCHLAAITSAGTALLGLLLRVFARFSAVGHPDRELEEALPAWLRPVVRLDPGGQVDRSLEKALPAKSDKTSAVAFIESETLTLNRRSARKQAKLWPTLILVADLGGLPVVIMLAEPSIGVEIAGLVVLLVLIGLLAWIYRSRHQLSQRIYDQFPKFEATADELRMVNADGSATVASRSAIDQVVQLQTEDYGKGTQLQFRDSHGKELARWELERAWQKAVIKWVRHLGYEVAFLGGERAREAARAGR